VALWGMMRVMLPCNTNDAAADRANSEQQVQLSK
jgi:hypothetical protein